MRMLLTARLDTETANRAVADGTLQKMIEGVVEHLKPEATYFTDSEGDRCCLMVFDMKDASEIPPAAEPLFASGAKISFKPVMTVDDLRTGLESLGK
ncbi:hypothetical protein [Actinacidiphila yeochonensis]|uniref:hypothetical protein n=1 Tax=Actinacidiphila yeochonensis TaxID=89050 RepID=UPI00056D71B5|nr:hypothetical protein [Actinacidiphila yeochonensis]